MRQLLTFILLALLISCQLETSKKSDWAEYETRHDRISLESVKKENRKLELFFIDSSTYFNHIITGQIGQLSIHELKLYEKGQYDSVKFHFETPIRDDSVAWIYVSSRHFEQFQEKFSDTTFSNFINDFMSLNWKHRDFYREEYSSLLDWVNTFFAIKIREKYKGQIDETAYFFGFDCYDIFIQYFKECKSGQYGEATEFVNLIQYDTTYINEEIRTELVNLIESYCN